MTDQPYTEADIDLVAKAMYEDDESTTPGGWYKPWAEASKTTWNTYRRPARAALGALAAAGRLLPEGSAPTPNVIRLRRRTPEERLAYLTAKRDEMLREGINPSMIEPVDQLMESDQWSTDE